MCSFPPPPEQAGSKWRKPEEVKTSVYTLDPPVRWQRGSASTCRWRASWVWFQQNICSPLRLAWSSEHALGDAPWPADTRRNLQDSHVTRQKRFFSKKNSLFAVFLSVHFCVSILYQSLCFYVYIYVCVYKSVLIVYISIYCLQLFIVFIVCIFVFIVYNADIVKNCPCCLQLCFLSFHDVNLPSLGDAPWPGDTRRETFIYIYM